MVCAHPLHGHGYGFVVPLLDGDHVTEEAGTGFVHTAPGHGREDFELWTANHRLLIERGNRHPNSLHGRRERRLHRRGAWLRRQARHHRQGESRRRQSSGHRCAGRGGRARRPRPAQASVSAQLAFEDPGHLPQHPAMVPGDGSAVRQCARRQEPSGHCGRCDRTHAVGAVVRREPDQGHGCEQARLGAFAPARLGRAAVDFRPQGRSRNPVRRRGERANRRRLRTGRRRRVVRRGREGAVPGREAQCRRLRQDR